MTADRSGRFIAGDPLRAIAAVSVLVFHVAEGIALSFGLNYPLLFGPVGGAVLSHLDLGLYLFFVLSGYFITRPFVRAYVEDGRMPRFPRYLRNRLLRIVPAYWAIFSLLYLRHLLLPDGHPRGTFTSTPYEVLPILAFIQNFYPANHAAQLVWPAWTLDVEMGFYLLVPAALFIVAAVPRPSRRQLRASLLVALVVIAAMGSLIFRGRAPVDDVWQRSLPAMLVAFTPGVLLAVLEPLLEPALARHQGARFFAFVFLALGLGFIWLYHLAGPYLPAFLLTAHTKRPLLAALGTGSLVAAPLWWQWCVGRAWAILDNGPLRWMGKRSYSLYLLHWGLALDVGAVNGVPPGHMTRGAYWELGIRLILLLPACLVGAAVCYQVFERPFLRLQERKAGGTTQQPEFISSTAVDQPRGSAEGN